MVFERIGTTVPFKVTLVALPRLEPLIVTVLPIIPLIGFTVEITGKVVIVNAPNDVATPPGVVTLNKPEVAPAGTVAVIVASSLTTNSALVPLNVTEVAPVKPEPNKVVVPPVPPWSGVKKLITGGGTTTVKFVPLVPVPLGVVTVIGPVVARVGTST